MQTMNGNRSGKSEKKLSGRKFCALAIRATGFPASRNCHYFFVGEKGKDTYED